MEKAAKTTESGDKIDMPPSEGAATPRRKSAKKNSGTSIEISLRIHNDGGPLFSSLVAIKDAHIRCDRVRQLLYQGLMREVELLRPASVSVGAPIAFVPQAPSQPSPSPVIAEADVEEAEPSSVRFNPNDIGEWFSA